MNSLTVSGSAISGTAALRDCLAAERTILRSLSVLSTFLSECSPMTGTNLSVPTSVAFSTNHSYLSMFLVGQTAISSL